MKHVTPEFQNKLRKALGAFDVLTQGRTFSHGRVVLYAGVSKPNAWDLQPSEFPVAIEEWLTQGFLVGWDSKDECLYLYVQ